MVDLDRNKPGVNLVITGDWAVQSQQLKEEYEHLTDADLKFEAGKENELFGRLAIRLRKNREEVIHIIEQGHVERLP